MTLAARQRKPSYAEVATPKRENHVSEEDIKRNVKVVVRIRPENNMEKNGNSKIVVKAMNEHVLVFDPNEQSSPEYGYRNRHKQRNMAKRQCKDLKFAFDYVFDPGSANPEIYQQTTKKILDSFLEGYNCSVFAYGSTGAGKTHTMLGNAEKPGVMYLTMMDLYNRINDMERNITCDVAVSYLEVYNEQIRDLLMGGKTLPVREDAQKGVVVPGLSLHKPRDADELLHMLQYGNQNRTQHATDANAESSRSHAVFQVFVRQKDRTANVSAEVKVAKLCLVDLAGSERATVTKNRGTRFREGANINRSLLALGNVINSLADPKYKGHVPYRDSKLTRLLKDSLGGNCQTVMIAAVSPSSMTYEDTYNTLKYADRAKNIQSNLKKNVVNVEFHVARYGQIVEELRKEILELKEKLRFFEDGKLVNTVCQTSSIEVCRLKEKLNGVFCSRLKLTREYLDAELKSRDIQWRIHRKEKCLGRMALISDSKSGLAEKMKKMVTTSQHRLHGFHANKDNTVQCLVQNKKILAEMDEAIKTHCNSSGENLETENLKLTLQIHQTSIALTESQYCVKYLTKVVKSQEREIQSTERMINSVLQLVRQQHFIMKGSNIMTNDIEEDYRQIQLMAEGREVSFADQTFDAGKQPFSLSGLLDFKSLPSEEMSATTIMSTGSIQKLQTDNDYNKPNNFVKHVSVNSQKSTSAGNTPFPKGQIIEDSKEITNRSSLLDEEQYNICHLERSKEDKSLVTNSSKASDLGKFDSKSNNCRENKQNSEHLQKILVNSNSNIVSSSNDSCISSQSLNGTFTVEDNKGFNSTFTLMETNESDPEVLARTPVIADECSTSTICIGTQNEHLNRSQVPDTQCYTGGNVDTRSVTISNIQHTSHYTDNVSGPYSITDNHTFKSQKPRNVTALQSNTNTHGNMAAMQSNACVKENVTALQSNTCVQGNVSSQSDTCVDGNVSLPSNTCVQGNATALQSKTFVSESMTALQSNTCAEDNTMAVKYADNLTALQSSYDFDVNVLQSENNKTALLPRNDCIRNNTALLPENYTTVQSLNSQRQSITDTQKCTDSTNFRALIKDNVSAAAGMHSKPTTIPTTDISDRHSQVLSKEKTDNIENVLPGQVKCPAVRSLIFGGIPGTPDSVKKVKSYAEVAQSPPVLRTPLRVINTNTPLSQQNQGTTSPNKKSMVKVGNLFGDYCDGIKETSKKLNELGLPSLMERWHTDPRKKRSGSSQKPSYMQPTKSARYKNKPNNFKRSQSVSNVPRPGWQI